MAEGMMCKHLEFDSFVTVTRLGETGRCMLDLRVRCKDCLQPFEFMGMPIGADLGGAMMSEDHQEARLAIVPKGEKIVAKLDGVRGFVMQPKGL